ncbi:hypothetical protein [Staphylococcus coagulans]|uniref:Uncharacterized protein n=1 Tax=Staphylococcus coagulans TaxID=74706 RepID=A0A9X0PDV0_9STAP|nr:hypothetical protein [Staphylococcus coagulans]MBA8772082.1 hypothetical protein [Staphylococcus coagulans]MBA8775962.1 hypothetical protein [Staphylococcus coagulans]
MADVIHFHPERFAEAYIQTLPFAKSPHEFADKSEFVEYMEKRREQYFQHFVDSIEFAEGRAVRIEDFDK